MQDFITGFLQNGRIYGRPADVMSMGKDAFLFTDDYSGVVYYVCQRASDIIGNQMLGSTYRQAFRAY